MLFQAEQVFFHSWYSAFFISLLFFISLYFLFTLSAYWITQRINRKQKINQEEYHNKQIITEIIYSLQSIFIFSLQAIIVYYLYKYQWISINWKLQALSLLPEIVLLFLWNEIHFYIIHRFMHIRWFYKKVHYIHHASKAPTPFSVYSFHWLEAALLGSVILFPLAVYNFQAIALISLPVISLFLNALGHWDYDLKPDASPDHWLRFSFRHSLHHKYIKGNYGFFLTIFDKLFNSKLDDELK